MNGADCKMIRAIARPPAGAGSNLDLRELLDCCAALLA
jgi:hypothetical protein